MLRRLAGMRRGIARQLSGQRRQPGGGVGDQRHRRWVDAADHPRVGVDMDQLAGQRRVVRASGPTCMRVPTASTTSAASRSARISG